MHFIKSLYNFFFGKDYRPIWEQFALEKGGDYKPMEGHRVCLTHKSFEIAIDVYTHYSVVGASSFQKDYTRAKVEFITDGNFELLMVRQGLLENIGKLFGLEDIEVNNKEFDKNFLVSSNDESKTLLILSDNRIIEWLINIKPIRFHITNKEGLFNEKPAENKYMIYFVMEGEIRRIEKIEQIYNLLCIMIERLVKYLQIQSANPMEF